MSEIEAGRQLHSPVIEGGPDRLGVLETGDRSDSRNSPAGRSSSRPGYISFSSGLSLLATRSSISLSATAIVLPSGFLKPPLLVT